jgi:hypothetical protein
MNSDPFPADADVPLITISPVLWGANTYNREFSQSPSGTGTLHTKVKEIGFRSISAYPGYEPWSDFTNTVDVVY